MMSEQDKQQIRRNGELLRSLVARRVSNLKREAGGRRWTACCPFHTEKTPSFTVFTEGQKGPRFQCFGCGVQGDVFEFVARYDGIETAEAFRIVGKEAGVEVEERRGNGHGNGHSRGKNQGRRRVVAAYDYVDEDGYTLFQVQRLEPKTFRQRAWIDGQWLQEEGCMNGVRRVLYRLPSLLAAAKDEPVFLVEGEKDADNLRAETLIATTNSGGAGKWRSEYNEFFRDRHVCIIQDDDKTGKEHAEKVRRELQNVAASVVVLGLSEHDATDWLNDGHNGQELKELWRKARENPKSSPGDKPNLSRLKLLYGEAAAIAPEFENTVVRGLLHKGSISLIYGKPKSGKSFLATDLALAIASDQLDEWMGHRIRQHGPVLYVACEGHGGYWKRLKATGKRIPHQFVLATGRPTLIEQIDERGFIYGPNANDIVLAIAEVMVELKREPVVVIIDTVFRSFGRGNVNNSQDMNAYIAAAQELADRGIAVMLVHHSAKGGPTPAGSVALAGAADTLILVQKDPETKQHTWEVEEAKDDMETPKRRFDLEVIRDIPDAFGEMVSSCRVVDQEYAVEETKEEKKARKAAEKAAEKAAKVAEAQPETKPEAKPKPSPEPTNAAKEVEVVNSAIEGLFMNPDIVKEVQVMPGNDAPVPVVTREQLRTRLSNIGFLGEPGQPLPHNERVRLQGWLRRLVAQGAIVVSGEAICFKKPASP